ncbi:hypothetical protein ACIA2T_15745 [Amycolatopsis japonica]|uniref:hypothetical protein n=1 Tax=Amycolatopsis japonica TaxID=208439 RepID=UPI00378CDE86
MLAEEIVGRVHLERGGVGASEENRLFRSFGKVAALGLFDGAQLGFDVGNHLLRQRLVVESVECAANTVCCFLDAVVGLNDVAVLREVGLRQGLDHGGERVALTLSMPPFGVLLQAVGGTGRMRVPVPQLAGQAGQGVGKPEQILVRCGGGKFGDIARYTAEPCIPGADKNLPRRVEGVDRHEDDRARLEENTPVTEYVVVSLRRIGVVRLSARSGRLGSWHRG